jgi:hypothetical protein
VHGRRVAPALLDEALDHRSAADVHRLDAGGGVRRATDGGGEQRCPCEERPDDLRQRISSVALDFVFVRERDSAIRPARLA